MATRVGIIGLGMMGRTHYEAYQKLPGVQVVAVADENPARAKGDLRGTAGNVLEGGLQQLPMDKIQGFTDFRKLIALDEVDIVDICVPTPAHASLAIEAIKAGKHVLCEKPLGRTSAEAQQIADAVVQAKGLFMPAMCIRFWPEYAWAKKAIDEKRFGKVISATFRRLTSLPGGWFGNGKLSGGGVLDLHIHDTDFVYYAFGKPDAVFARGYSKHTGEIDHVVTQYLYKDIPLVSAEGGWAFQAGYGFTMQFIMNFENATLDYDLARGDQAFLLIQNGKKETLQVEKDTGYEAELKYFLNCVNRGQKPTVVNAADAVPSIRIVEAEVKSIETGQVVRL